MKSPKSYLAAAVLGSAMLIAPAQQASAQEGGIELGILTCDTVAGTRVNLIIRSTVDVKCTFKGSSVEEHYKGETGIGLGIDLNISRDETIAFTVLAAKSDMSAGAHALTGKYVGAKASVTVGVGLGAAVLVGGGEKNFSLQPIALETSTGFGLSGGVGYLYLEPAAR